MQNLNELLEIIKTYKKHKWILRSFLLEDNLDSKLRTEIDTLFKDIEIRPSTINAAWFSRRSGDEREAWELRLLSGQPFALVETFTSDQAENRKTEIRKEMETRVIKLSSKNRAGH